MTSVLRQGLVALGCLAAVIVLLMVTALTSRLRTANALQYDLLCDAIAETDRSLPFHMVFFLDVNACLTCNEDMDAWRELVIYLRENDLGSVVVYSPRADSADVQWAMQLEGISNEVRVLEDEIVKYLGWDNTGVPVKLLLDNQCRPLEIAGWMGNAPESRRFIERIIQRISTAEGLQ